MIMTTNIAACRTDVRNWLNSLAVDTESCIEIDGKYVTGIVIEKWDETYDSSEYEYRFAVDGEEADWGDVVSLSAKAFPDDED